MARRKTTTSKYASFFSSSSTSTSTSSSSSSSSARLCAICGETAIGTNFGCQTCMSCKAFFRRHARNEKEQLECPFVGQCPIDQVRRKFCSACRLKKCFRMGMLKENILTEEQRVKMREKIAQNRLRREQKSKATPRRKRKSSVISNSSSSSKSNGSTSSSTSHCEGDSSIIVEYLLKQQQTEELLKIQKDSEQFAADPCSVSVLGPDSYFPGLLAKSEYDDLYIGGCGGGDYPEWPMDPYLDQFCNELLLLNSGEEELFRENSFSSSSSSSSSSSPSSSATEHTKKPSHLKDFHQDKFNTAKDDHDYTAASTESSSPPETPEPYSSNNFLLSYLNSSGSLASSIGEDFLEPLNPFPGIITRDPVIESLHPVADPRSVYDEIGFSPAQELLLPEKCLLQELTAACSVLQNRYTRLETVAGEDGGEDLGGRASHLSACLFNRLEQAANRLGAFRRLNAEDRRRMLQGPSLLEMAAIRSVLLYDEFRDAWCVFDDKEKTSVFLKLDRFAPFCTTAGNSIERHKAFPRLFYDEWKRDSIIFDLLTAVLLFTPRPEYCALEEIEDSFNRYRHLLRRYLAVKYASAEEAERAYAKLEENLEEMRALSPDVQSFFQSSSSSVRPPFAH